jgi:FtsH-binding integral membrane protein
MACTATPPGGPDRHRLVLFHGLIGIVIASLVNLFPEHGAAFHHPVVGVLVFVGLSAYDTQRIKLMYLESDAGEVATKKAIMGR